MQLKSQIGGIHYKGLEEKHQQSFLDPSGLVNLRSLNKDYEKRIPMLKECAESCGCVNFKPTGAGPTGMIKEGCQGVCLKMQLKCRNKINLILTNI